MIKFVIKKLNGTILTKEVDPSNEDYCKKLVSLGWKEEKKVVKKDKKSKKTKGGK